VSSEVTGRRFVAHVQSAGVAAAVAWAREMQDAGVVAEFALVPASLEDVYASWVSSEGAA
jgi:ABC-2 type transport system ATP-binding protein